MKITLKVSDMTCDHCRMTIEKALNNLPQIQRVTINLPEHLVQTEGDLPVDQVTRAINDLGYHAIKVISVD